MPLTSRRETEATKRLYGIGHDATDVFGRQCLLARRLVERGVRFVQLYHTTGGFQPWDQHSDLKGGHARNALATDRPIAGLLHDLRARGLLEETLVIWGGEFGRTPAAEGTDGRDHHPYGFTMWLAGGGVRGGLAYGATDEFGWDAVEDRVHVHDLHATILHLLGLDHEKLTYRHSRARLPPDRRLRQRGQRGDRVKHDGQGRDGLPHELSSCAKPPPATFPARRDDR